MSHRVLGMLMLFIGSFRFVCFTLIGETFKKLNVCTPSDKPVQVVIDGCNRYSMVLFKVI